MDTLHDKLKHHYKSALSDSAVQCISANIYLIKKNYRKLYICEINPFKSDIEKIKNILQKISLSLFVKKQAIYIYKIKNHQLIRDSINDAKAIGELLNYVQPIAKPSALKYVAVYSLNYNRKTINVLFSQKINNYFDHKDKLLLQRDMIERLLHKSIYIWIIKI